MPYSREQFYRDVVKPVAQQKADREKKTVYVWDSGTVFYPSAIDKPPAAFVELVEKIEPSSSAKKEKKNERRNLV